MNQAFSSAERTNSPNRLKLPKFQKPTATIGLDVVTHWQSHTQGGASGRRRDGPNTQLSKGPAPTTATATATPDGEASMAERCKCNFEHTAMNNVEVVRASL